MAPDTDRYRLYSDLAAWWPLISPPEEYTEEAAFAARLLGQAARPVEEVLELGSGGGHVHVVQRRDRHDHVKRSGPQVICEEIPGDVLHAGAVVLLAGPVDDRPIAVDRQHVRHNLPQFPGQAALAAPHVQAPLAARRDGAEDQWVVVDVVVPGCWLRSHRARSCHGAARRRREGAMPSDGHPARTPRRRGGSARMVPWTPIATASTPTWPPGGR